MSSIAALQLLDLIQSHRVTTAIYIAAKLGIADLLSQGGRPLSDLVAATGTNEDALARLLIALQTIGLCVKDETERWNSTELGQALAQGESPSLRDWAIFEAEMLSKSWAGMTETMMTGKTAAEIRGFASSFDMMAQAPDQVALFNAAMASLTAIVTRDVLEVYDFSNVAHLVDVGGGSGELIGAIASRYPHLQGTVFDLPRCAERATAHLASLGLGERTGFVGGDFFQSMPALGDTIILKSVIHDWDDERSSIILFNCRRALPAGGRLLLVERIMPRRPSVSAEHRAHAMSDLNMLRGPGGKERTEREYQNLLENCRLEMTGVRPAGRFAVIEARPRLS